MTQSISEISAYPISYAIPSRHRVRLGIGTAVKRDAVIVKVTTSDGVVGFGEAHHGRAPGAIAHLVNSTLRELLTGRDALDVVAAWKTVYRGQLASHGTGAAASMALSGIDMALWDIRGKVAGWPLHRLLGGGRSPVRAYAGGVALGHQPPDELCERVDDQLRQGFRAVKVRLGDSPSRDIERMESVREAVGDEVEVLTDANTAYTLADVRAVLPALERLGAGWLEEPFPPHDHRAYAAASGWSRVPIAAGENHFTRYEFHRLIEDGAVAVLQPDLSKAGGVTEVLRIAALASAWKLPIHPHTSMTGLNMAATVHLLASIDNGGYFEADASPANPFRSELTSVPYEVAGDGTVLPLGAPGLGLEVDEDFISSHPLIDGPCYV